MRLSELNDTSSAAEGKIKSLLLFCDQCRVDLNHAVQHDDEPIMCGPD